MHKKSFLKWAGSKGNALHSLLSHIPRTGGVWVEPFVGSATPALNVEYDRFILSDINTDLINLMRWVVDNPKEVVAHVTPYFTQKHNTKEAFYALRARYNQSTDSKERAILFLYLNRHCYNGLMRYNSSGGYNTPFGDYKAPRVPVEQIYNFSKHFMGRVKFVSSPFDKVKFVRREGVTAYCDPPYLPLSPTSSFVGYSQKGFCQKDHLKLDRRARFWAERCSSVWVSNHAVPVLSKCYPSAKEVHSFMVSRSISQNIHNRKPVEEVLLKY
ncbi:Dam family site-specific DNA-(adenine-N6)-methyltransferase [Alteromonas sp. 14N.309.X.WAT.G.H12]|uniref:DNA adenine methylase n=1 Tax=Alteromonas sp. 14N.309.X.WAT.G.H12 TaxID=3120824 RepID=UPI002FD73614